MNNVSLPIQVIGHVHMVDDLGTVLLDKKNAVHPQNMARVIARALANESNYFIHRIAFGNGGTVVTGAGAITYNTPNDGITDNAGYASQLYNETYYEIIDENGIMVGTGPGANPSGDGPSTPNVQDGIGVYSEELGLISKVIISATLNPGEPSGQYPTDNLAAIEDTEGDFTFDEIALFTSGAPNSPTAGYQTIDVGGKVNTDNTGLLGDGLTEYYFDLFVDGVPINVVVGPLVSLGGSGLGGLYTYDDIIPMINAQLGGAAVASVTESGVSQTYGMIQITSATTGVDSTVEIVDETLGSPGPSNEWLFGQLIGFNQINASIDGLASGQLNNPVQPSTEVERMLTHIIFSPVLKSANRQIQITYTLTVQVAQSL